MVSCRNLLMESKHSALQNQASLVASSLAPLGQLRADEVGKVMELLGDVSLARVLVTDEERASSTIPWITPVPWISMSFFPK